MLRLNVKLRQLARKQTTLLLTTNTQSNKSATRSFALFNASQQRDGSQLQQQQRTHEEIVRSIDTFRSNIRQKSQQGYALSKGISEAVEENKHIKLQRYEVFIDKMQRLYKSEVRFGKKMKKRFQIQKNAVLYSLNPLKEILKAYNDLTARGFNSEATVETLKNISAVLRARGYNGRPRGDYSTHELDQSWRMQKLVDDLKFGLRPDQFFSPAHLAQTSLGLGDIGYKNTEVIPLMFQKLNIQLDERQLGFKTEQTELKFQDAVYGGPKGFVDRHYVFKGFQNNQEFNEYLQILMEWEKDATETTSQIASSQQLDEEAAEIQRSMHDIINASVQVKELQKEHQSSIDNLRQQYFQMSEAADKHSFLMENQYIKYDLLELQELLVKGGYLDPEEASQALSHEPFEQRMQRAADVFYDYVVNYAPEMLSPQHNNFYETAVNTGNVKTKTFGASATNYLEENQNLISLKTLSQTLVGLSEQALSFRRDVQLKDYLNKFYEEYLMPYEKRLYNHEFYGTEKARDNVVLMERCYLKAWQQFKENADRIAPRLAQLVKEDKDSIEGQLNALSALTACRLDQPAVRAEIVSNALGQLNKVESIAPQAVISGLKGLAEGASIDEKARQLAQRLATRLDLSQGLTFREQLDSVWSMCALQLYDAKVFPQVLKQLNQLNFERIENDLKYDEYIKLLDVYNALQFEAPKNLNLRITNAGLLAGLQGQGHVLGLRYREERTKYDPFKQRVVQALAKGLSNASVEHQVISENELYQQQTLDTNILNAAKYPYKPDIVMGYKGHKVGVFVLPETSTTSDTHQADGTYRFRMRVLEQAHEGRLRVAALSIQDVVSYNIEKLSVELNKEFNFTKTLDTQLRLTGPQSATGDFSLISGFGSRFVGKAVSFIEKLPSDRDVQKMDSLIKRLYQLMQVKQQTELRFEPLQRAAGFDEIRFQMMKLSLLYDSLNDECKKYVDEFCRPSASDFKGLLQATLATIPKNEEHVQLEQGLDSSWLGTRLEVELPVAQNSQTIKKSIVPEMINQRFMWVDDYFHYDDWRAKQKQVFDNFNLLVVPTSSQDGNKFFFDKDHHNRRIPQGVFPYPNHKRQLMLPSTNNSVTELLQGKHNDDYVLFEKEPYKMMVITELKKAETLLALDDDTSMITNLQNVKQGLKSDYTDKEILNTILLNLNFTEQLIEEHLKGSTKKEAGKLVSRDASKYRQFVESTYHSKDREDPFSHFYLKEAKDKELVKTWIEEEKQLSYETELLSRDDELREKGNQRRNDLATKIENVLLAEDLRNEDIIDLSSSGLKSRVDVRYDMRSLVKSENIEEGDAELRDAGISDEEYLANQRRRAEAKLIKMKIVYKINQAGSKQPDLTANEKAYLKKWIGDIKNGKERNVTNLRDSMVPKETSKLTLNDVDAKSLYALNSISRVSIEREKHGQFALNDLVLELSHFLDEDVLNKVETEVYSDRLRKEWGLSSDFKVVETRNKEISLVLNELEELAWRSAGQFTEKDFENIKAMISVKRNKDYFDRHFYDNDMKSFRTFFETVNLYDDRLALLERWLVRKEDEIKSRVVRPSADLQKSEQELAAQVDAPLMRARERLASRLLIADEFGNAIEKEYKDLTSKELHSLTENLCLRLYLFNYEYPAFLPQVVRAVQEHPNLLKSDEDQLNLYCKMFEVDWRGDQKLENKTQFMVTNPIYLDGTNLKSYGEVSNEVVMDKLQRACAPYVEETANKLLSMSNNQ